MNVKQLEEKLATTHGVNEKLDVLDELASYYYDHDNYQKAITYYKEAEKLAPAGTMRGSPCAAVKTQCNQK